MKKKSTGKRLLAALMASAILLSSFTVNATELNGNNGLENIVNDGSATAEENSASGNTIIPAESSISGNGVTRSGISTGNNGTIRTGFSISDNTVIRTEDSVSDNEMARTEVSVSDNEVFPTEGDILIGVPKKVENTGNSRLVQGEKKDEKTMEVFEDSQPQSGDIVEFMVVLDKEPLLSVFSMDQIRKNTAEVAAYRSEQEAMIAQVEAALSSAYGQQEGFGLGYSHILSTTSVSVRTGYGNREAIEAMEGVERVYVSPSFSISTTTESMDAGMYTGNAPGMIGATLLNDTGYTGKGMKIAIIDTGIVVDHPSFKAMSEDKLTEDSMTEAYVDGIWSLLNAGRSTSLRNVAYYSNKLPFTFNYYRKDFDVSHKTASHDHGTHVAGIAAANKVDGLDVVGVAPDAQLIVMQVFNPSGGADWSTILAALEDCVVLGVDTVNLSLGSAAGFTDGDREMQAVLERFEHTDTNVIIAGGNDTNNSYMNLTGTNMSRTKNIDNGLIGTPATVPGAVAVASADNDGADLPYFTVQERKVGFSDSALTMYTNFLGQFQRQELDFVVLDGIGDAGDYAGKDVQDKVVVVARGTISFQDKQKLAKENGAKALVVYNNVPGSFSMAISDGEGHIPCIAISRSDGEWLKTLSSGTLTVGQSGELTHVSVDASMSYFSSWGVTPDLKLKPEITGVGGNIYSTRDPQIGGSNYGTMSGTSMASPQVAGAITILSEYLQKTYNDKYQGKDLRLLATNLLMSTAAQIREGETLYSPRNQGAGLVDLTKATQAGAYLSSTSTHENRPKGEMGDNDSRNGVFSFGFTITNITDTQKTYTFDSIVMAPDVDSSGNFMSNTNRDLSARVVVKQGGEQKAAVLVPANGSVELQAELVLTGDDKNFINSHYETGTYVEGYLYAKEEGGVSLSMPFLGFFGDWSESPVFDDEGEDASLYSTSIKTYKSKLGQNPYITSGKAGDRYNAISSANPLDQMVFGMMRNSKKVTQSVVSKDGNTQYFTWGENNSIKSYYSASYGMIIPYYLYNYNEEIYIWDGKDNGKTLPDNTTVTYTISSYLDDGDDKVDDTYSFDVTIDNTKPVVVNADKLGESVIKDYETGTVTLPVTIEENHYVAAVIFETADGEILGKYEVDNVPGQASVQEFDVTGYGTDFVMIVADYACNETEVGVSLDLSDMNSAYPPPIELSKDRIYGNETYSDGYVSMGWFSAKKEDFSDLRNETFDTEGRTYSGEYINGYVIAQRASDGALLLLTPYNSYWNTKVIWSQEGKSVGGEGFIVLYDMAMDYASDKLYAIGWQYKGDKDGDSKDDGYNTLFEIQLETEVNVAEAAKISGLEEGVEGLTLACTTEGQLYTISTQGKLYKLDKDGSTTEIGTTDFVNENNYSGVNVIQSMCYDHETKEMYWYAHSQTRHGSEYINVGGLYKVNLTDASLTRVGGKRFQRLYLPVHPLQSEIGEDPVQGRAYRHHHYSGRD